VRLFVDTSAWFAYVNKAEPQHAAVAKTLERRGEVLLTTNWVLAETLTLARRKLGHPAAVRLSRSLRESAVELVAVGAPDEEQAWQLFQERDDKPYSFTDCTSFVVMRALGIDRVATLDADFLQEGFKVLP
jgi:predicted nucleic acid-binding protein